ncbi:MAG: hypothetical protein H0X25_03140 [Acidobacteriales bacterium]|nr:hypothetical protein [Terriglobales bacterium]
MTPTASGPWTFTQIYAFQNGRDGTDPQAIAIDAAGNIDGTSYIGLFHHGLVFQLKRAAGGTYSFNTLHKFPNQGGSDGEYPQGKIVLDPQGNLYGTASFGGSKLYGIVYQLVPGADGTWTENILHNFANGSDGATPYNGVTLDRQGNLFGSTYYGGGLGQCADRSQTCGTVFKLAPDGQGGWTETILHAFAGFKHDGSYANSAPILDPAGVLYGTTAYGGGAGDCRTDPTFNSYCGIVYSLQP